jgi:hypothetical protein
MNQQLRPKIHKPLHLRRYFSSRLEVCTPECFWIFCIETADSEEKIRFAAASKENTIESLVFQSQKVVPQPLTKLSCQGEIKASFRLRYHHYIQRDDERNKLLPKVLLPKNRFHIYSFSTSFLDSKLGYTLNVKYLKQISINVFWKRSVPANHP